VSDEEQRSFSRENEFLSIYWDSEEEILYQTYRGVQDVAEVEQINQIHQEFRTLFSDIVEAGVDGVVDVSGQERVTMKARKGYAQMAKETAGGRTAVFGVNPLMKAVLSFVSFASGRKDLFHICSSREEAVQWIKEQRAKS